MERIPCEFFLIRYVPDVVKGEFTNIGVVLREVAGDGGKAVVRFTRDWRRVRCIDAEADIELLEALEQEIGARLRSGASARDPKDVLETLEDSLSNSVQISPAGACLAESVITELELLMKMYVEPLKVVRTRARVKSGRAAIVAAMRTEFERAGVWGLMSRGVPAAKYTKAGDPMKIDCGYRSNGTLRLFQAVSLAGDVEGAKGLAYSAKGLSEGVTKVEGRTLKLTAVVEPLRAVSDLGDEAEERYEFGRKAMEDAEIRVLTLNNLASAADTARREFRL